MLVYKNTCINMHTHDHTLTNIDSLMHPHKQTYKLEETNTRYRQMPPCPLCHFLLLCVSRPHTFVSEYLNSVTPVLALYIVMFVTVVCRVNSTPSSLSSLS